MADVLAVDAELVSADGDERELRRVREVELQWRVDQVRLAVRAERELERTRLAAGVAAEDRAQGAVPDREPAPVLREAQPLDPRLISGQEPRQEGIVPPIQPQRLHRDPPA